MDHKTKQSPTQESQFDSVIEGGMKQDENPFTTLVMRQFERCISEGSKEMTRAGVVQRFIDGQAVQIALPDQFAIFTSTVKQLYTILKPHLDDYDDVKKKVEAQIDDIRNCEAAGIKAHQEENQKYPANLTPDKYRMLQHKLTQIEHRYEARILGEYNAMLQLLSELLFHMNYFQRGSR